MTLAERFTGTNDTYAGKVAYRYCLSCDSVLSERIEYSPTISTTITSWKRYEYDGLNLLRMDERYDTAGGAISDQDPWRTLEVSTHKPGSLGALIGKRVYTYNAGNYTSTPNATNDYTYTYDAVGNVVAVYNANSTERGYEKYYFAQDAFGNELAVSPFLSYSPPGTTVTWASARTVGITEHQTGKWIDPFTGLYFFHARWYDSGVGRFVGRGNEGPEEHYKYCANIPSYYADPDGLFYFPPTNPDYLVCKREQDAFKECLGWRNWIPGENPYGDACGGEASWDCSQAQICLQSKGIVPRFCKYKIGQVPFGDWGEISFLGYSANLCVHAYFTYTCECPSPWIMPPVHPKPGQPSGPMCLRGR